MYDSLCLIATPHFNNTTLPELQSIFTYHFEITAAVSCPQALKIIIKLSKTTKFISGHNLNPVFLGEIFFIGKRDVTVTENSKSGSSKTVKSLTIKLVHLSC